MSLESDSPNLEDRPVAEVDRIRDIIFGPQMRLYEQQFKRAAGQFDLLSKQLEELRTALDQQRADQESRTRKAQEEMLQHYTELERTWSSRIEKLEAKLDQQTTEIRAESRQARGELASRMEQQGAELKAQAQQLAADLRKQGQDLRAEFTASLDALDDDKASRHTLADLLVEMGARLKEQMGVADLLGQLGEMAETEPSD
jgi:predicted RNA-binding protein with PIN domain